MTKSNKNPAWITRFDEVVTYMEKNLDKWNSIEEIRKTYDEFTHNLKKIKELQPELEQDLAPVKKELESNRELLIQKLFPLVNILEVYSEDHKMGKKTRSHLLSRKQLAALSNKKLLVHATSLNKLISKYMHRTGDANKGGQISPAQDIKRYGLTQSMMDDLNSASHQYESSMHLLKDVFIYRNKVKKKRDALVRTNKKLLTKRLNKLMTVFSGTHPSFYQEYHGIFK
ncbi:hypothetical protein ACFLTA_10245 [Bacteroidota bacterium]